MGCSREPQYLFVASAWQGPRLRQSWGYCVPMDVAQVSEKNADPRAPSAGLGESQCWKQGCWTTEPEGISVDSGLRPHRGSQELHWLLNPAVSPALHLPSCCLFLCEAPRVVLCPGWTQERSDWVRQRKVKIVWYWPCKIMVPMRLFTKERHRCRKQT